jgi:hypothetical protein
MAKAKKTARREYTRDDIRALKITVLHTDDISVTVNTVDNLFVQWNTDSERHKLCALCLSEIKHAHTDDGVRQEMAWAQCDQRHALFAASARPC